MSRIQKGSLRLRACVNKLAFWEFRYRLTEAGVRRLKAIRLGTVDELPTRAAAREKLRELNPLSWPQAPRQNTVMTELIDRFEREEHLAQIATGTYKNNDGLKYSTAYAYLHILSRYIRPRWGNERIANIRPAAVQEWLLSLPGMPCSKAKIKALLHRLFERAMLWDLLKMERNPIALVEIRGTSRRKKVPMVLTEEQFHAIIGRLPQPHRTMVLVAQCLGLRVSEILGLQWPDVDFERSEVRITRGIVNGRVGEVKTEFSRDVLPLDTTLATALLEWRAIAPTTSKKWVFANPTTLRPYTANALQKKWLYKIGRVIGLPQPLGWHTFRHTYRTWLDANGTPIGVQQKLMRHAHISTTMNVYGNALMQSKRDAHEKIVRMALAGS
jgi:integrase